MCRGLILSNILFNVMITIHRKLTMVVWLTCPWDRPLFPLLVRWLQFFY